MNRITTHIICGFFALVLLVGPIITKAEVIIGETQVSVEAKLGKPAITKEMTDGVAWKYIAPKLTVFFDKSGHVTGWIQKHQ